MRSDADGKLLGFATCGTFRHFPAFQYTIEHSVYVGREHRARGLGRALLEALIDRATQSGHRTMVGVIDSANPASLALHRALGFEHCGTLRQAGFKFGRWLDVEFHQLLLIRSEAGHG